MSRERPRRGPGTARTIRDPERHSEHLRAIATGVLIGQRSLSLTQATVLFAATARASRRSADEVAREIIRGYGTRDDGVPDDPG